MDKLFYPILKLLPLQKEEEDQGLILNKILQECGSLLKVDLPGINVLLPSFFTMVDKFLSNPV